MLDHVLLAVLGGSVKEEAHRRRAVTKARRLGSTKKGRQERQLPGGACFHELATNVSVLWASVLAEAMKLGK